MVPAGGLEVVSLARLQPHAAEAVVGMVTAGCSPVRVVRSPHDGRLYVTARASNALLVFDSDRLVSEPADALLATVPVGNAPVGLELLDNGRRIVVADSARFGGHGGQTLTVIDASLVNQGGAAAVEGTVEVGHFPRELRLTDDGNTLLVADFDSNEIELLSVDRLTVQHPSHP